MNELNVINKDGCCYIDSREAANIIGKKHDQLLRDIMRYLKILKKSNSPNYRESDFFTESTYTDVKGETRPCYLISKRGAGVIANRLNSKQNVLFTAAYVTRFDEMEKQIKTERFAKLADTCQKAQHITGRILSAVFEAAFVPDKQKEEVLQGIYEQLGIQIPLEPSNVRMAYPVSDISQRLGILSLNGNPHTMAVSAIISMIPVADEHKLVIPYQNAPLIGYDDYVVNSVRKWLISNRFPSEIECGDKIYKVHYRHREMNDCN